jgi:hypothetical protein
MTKQLNQKTLPTVAVLDDLAKLVNYLLAHTLNCDPDAQSNRDHNRPRLVFTSHYVPVNPSPIKNPKYVAHNKINFHDLSFSDSIAQSVDAVSLAEITRMINVEIPLIEAEYNDNSEVAERWNHAKASGETGLTSSVMQTFSANYARPTPDRCQAERGKLDT